MKLVTFLVLWILAIAIGYAGMIFGWGIQPQSWTWIIGCSVANLVVLVAIQGTKNGWTPSRARSAR